MSLIEKMELVNVKRLACPMVREHIVLTKYVREFIKNCDKRILDLGILEINKNLNVSEVVEKAIEIIKEEAGPKLMEK